MNVDNKTPLQSFINQKADTLMQCGNYSIDIPPLKRDEQYRFHFDATACVGCHCCEAACNEQNGNPADVKWRRVGEMEGDTWIKNDMVKLGVAPHLPDIEVTKPTTRYTLYDNMPMLKPADAHIIKPAHAELPLLFMTVLTQMSAVVALSLVGALLNELLGRYLFYVSVVPLGLAGNFFAGNQRG